MTATGDNQREALTRVEMDAALAFSEAQQPSVTALADRLDIHPAQLLEILARPHVIRWASSVLAVSDAQDDILARRSQSTALQTLAEVAKDAAREPIERRRAATAILRATAARHRAAQGEEKDPSLLSALENLAAEGQSPAPAPSRPEDNPDPADLFEAASSAITRAAPDNLQPLRDIQQRCIRALRESSLRDFLARTQLFHAIGAAMIDHHVLEDGPDRAMQATFQTAAGPRTFQFTCRNCGVAAPRWRIASITALAPPEDDDPEDPDEAEFDPEGFDPAIDTDFGDLPADHDAAEPALAFSRIDPALKQAMKIAAHHAHPP